MKIAIFGYFGRHKASNRGTVAGMSEEKIIKKLWWLLFFLVGHDSRTSEGSSLIKYSECRPM